MSTTLTPGVQAAMSTINAPTPGSAPTEPTQSPAGAPPSSNTPAPKAEAPKSASEVDELADFWSGDIKIEGLEPLPDGEHTYKGTPPLSQYINLLPAPVKKQLHNIQAGFTRMRQADTQTIKELRAEVDKYKSLVDTDRKHIRTAIEQVNQNIGDPIKEEDIYANPENLQKYIKQQTMMAWKDTINPLNERLQAEETERSRAELVSSAQKFIDSKPEFKDEAFKLQVAELIKQQIPLEHAYTIVVAKNKEKASFDEQVEARNKKNDNRDRLRKVSTGSKTQPALDLKGKSAWEKVQAISDYKQRYGTLPPR